MKNRTAATIDEKALYECNTRFDRAGLECKQAGIPFNDIQARHSALFNCSFYCIFIHDFEGRFLDANNATLTLLGYSLKEIKSLGLTSLLAEDSLLDADTIMEEMKSIGPREAPIECKLKTKKGVYVWMEIESSVIYHKGRPYAVQGIARDVTAVKKMVDELHTLSLIDDLTGLYNRRGFMTFAERQLKIAERLKKDILLLFADVDSLKNINDMLGHQEGDRALVDAAEVLKDAFRGADIIARVGGDEFVVLAMIAPGTDGAILTNRLGEKMATFASENDRAYHLSISVGVTTYSHQSICSVYELLSSADKLMYHQKRSRVRHCTVIDSRSHNPYRVLSGAVA